MAFLLLEMVFKKKKKPRGGTPFQANDPRKASGSPQTDTPPSQRMREPKSIYDNVSAMVGGVPCGASLRPHEDEHRQSPLQNADCSSESVNWVVDQDKLFRATNHALECHNSPALQKCKSRPRKNHTPKLIKNKVIKVGLGVRVSFKCGFRNCQFESELYDLYEKTASGQPLPNLQIGVALSKTDITPKTVETLATTLNIDPPNPKTLQKSCAKALDCTEDLSELALKDNRSEVTSTLRLRGKLEPGQIPSVEVAIDGQFSNRSYHCPTGKSDSVSVPVVEQETGRGLIIQHVNLSHRDGSLPSTTHINSGETLGAKMNYEKTYLSPDYPLHYGVVTTDGDTGLVKALESGRATVGEKRPLKRRGCIFHQESAAKRKFTREALIKMTPAQKSQLEKHKEAPSLPTNIDPNTCAACLRNFKSSKGLNIHRRSCKGERAEECKIKGLEPLFLEWDKNNPNKKLTVKDKKSWRDSLRRWVMKRVKTELNLGIHAQNPQNLSMSDDSDIHEALFLAGETIVPCLSGNHDACLIDSRGCGGPDSPADYEFLPSKTHLGPIPPPTIAWFREIVATILSREALSSLVVNGKKGTTSLVESAHREIRMPIPKGRVYRKNESRLIKSGNSELQIKTIIDHYFILLRLFSDLVKNVNRFKVFCENI